MSKNLNYLLRFDLLAAFFLSTIWLFGSAAAFGASPEVPTNLLTQYISNPLAVDTIPHFSWTMLDADRGEYQSAFQIIVASTRANIDANIGDIWNSGKKLSSESTQVHYAGRPLASDTRYWWKVRTWDKSGNASPYSGFATFDMGLTTAEWTASFLWDGTDNANNFAYFRKKFSLSAGEKVSIAKIYVSGHDDYKLFLNGKEIGRGPARSNPYKRMLYNGYDITSELENGDNVIAAIGHYHGIHVSSGTSAVPAFILEARIRYTDGTTMTVKTDNSWKVLASTPWKETPYVYEGDPLAQSRCVEEYDARKEISGWKTTSFNDASWANASVVDRRTFSLKAQYIAKDTIQQIIAPVSIVQIGSDWIVDFGKCYNGWPRLTMTGNAPGSVVTVRYAETPNNYVDYDTYTCKGGIEIWEPDIAHESFRCIKIEGYSGTLTTGNINAAWSYTNADKKGNFECSNTLFNDIYNLCERSSRQNIQEGMVSVDAWREQSSYTVDAYILTGNCLYNNKNQLILQKTIQDYASEQLPSGNLRSRSPSTLVQEIPEWTLHWMFLLWNQYLFFDDQDILTENYSVMQRIFSYFDTYRNSSTNLLSNTPGWEISDWPNDPTDNSGSALTAQNCLYYQSLKIASQIASVLGKSNDSASYASLANNVKNGINAHLFDGVRKYKDCSGSSKYRSLSSCWPLMFDIVPENKIDSVLAYVKESGFTAKVYGGIWAFDALFKYDQGPYIYSLLNQPSLRWSNFLDPSLSLACWEDWPGMTYNHAWSSYPARFFLSGVLGIYPMAPGYSLFAFKPQVSGLTHASGIVPTVKGDIAADWTLDGTIFKLKVSIPVNCSCLVYLPTFSDDNIDVYEGTTLIWHSGVIAGSVPSVSFKASEKERLVWKAGSGSYEFKIKLQSMIR